MIKVYLSESHFANALKVFIFDETDHARRLFHYDAEHGSSYSWQEYPHGEAVADEYIKPSMLLLHESGRALLEALVRHYNGADDTRALRRDYDAERKRVDEQAKIIADVALTLARSTESRHD